MKKVSLLLSVLLILSIFQFAFVLAESKSGSSGSGSSSGSSDSDSGSGKSTSETKVETEGDRIKIEEKVRIGNVKREIKTEIRGDRIKEEIKEENGEFRQEMKQEIRTMLQDEREREIIEFKAKIRTQNGSIKLENRTIMIKELTDADKEIIAGKINAKTGLNLTAEDIGNGSRGSILRAHLSNGRYAEIKVLPDRAAAVAAEKLRIKCEDRNCTVVLKEVGIGNKSEVRYAIETRKDARTLGIFKARMKVEAHVNPETGEIIFVKKPWWAFLANEDDETTSSDPTNATNSTAGNQTNVDVEVETETEVNVTVNSTEETATEVQVNISLNVTETTVNAAI